MRRPDDPVEAVIFDALQSSGVRFRLGDNTPPRLDFTLLDCDVHIECKRMHTPRTCEQMTRADNIIVIQGLDAAKAFASMIGGSG